jgi:hypothetical protein
MARAARPTQIENGRWRIRWVDETGARQSEVIDSYREAEYQLQLRRVAVEERRRGLRTAAVQPKLFDAIWRKPTRSCAPGASRRRASWSG